MNIFILSKAKQNKFIKHMGAHDEKELPEQFRVLRKKSLKFIF